MAIKLDANTLDNGAGTKNVLSAASSTATVNNTAPTVGFSGPSSSLIDSGDSTTYTLTFTDAASTTLANGSGSGITLVMTGTVAGCAATGLRNNRLGRAWCRLLVGMKVWGLSGERFEASSAVPQRTRETIHIYPPTNSVIAGSTRRCASPKTSLRDRGSRRQKHSVSYRFARSKAGSPGGAQ
mgnify:CR=1 FL=1